MFLGSQPKGDSGMLRARFNGTTIAPEVVETWTKTSSLVSSPNFRVSTRFVTA
jgi:hypothetical protein